MKRHVHRNKPAWWWGAKRRARWWEAERALQVQLTHAFWNPR